MALEGLNGLLGGILQDILPRGIEYYEVEGSFVFPIYASGGEFPNPKDPGNGNMAFPVTKPTGEHIVYLLARDYSQCSECERYNHYVYGIQLKRDISQTDAVEEIHRSIPEFVKKLRNDNARPVDLDGGDLGIGDNL